MTYQKPPPNEKKFKHFIKHASKEGTNSGYDPNLIKNFYDIVSNPEGYDNADLKTHLEALEYVPDGDDLKKIKNLVDSTKWFWNLHTDDY